MILMYSRCARDPRSRWCFRAITACVLAIMLGACGAERGQSGDTVETIVPASSSPWGPAPLSIERTLAEVLPPADTHGVALDAPVNSAPSIEGEPSEAVLIDNDFSFEPYAFDSDGDELTFSIVNLPSWASFDMQTGRVVGTPGAADIGYYDEISISVTDGYNSTTLSPFGVDVVAAAHGTLTVTLAPPAAREDGSASGEISGYRIYWGTEEGSYSGSARLDLFAGMTHVIDGLLPATYYIVATVIDGEGVESDFSAPVEFTLN